MQALEMHIEVNQRLQKVGLFVNDSYFEEEVDLALNKAQDRVVKELVNKKFQDKQLRTAYIRSLLEKNKELTVFIDSTDENAGYGVLPPDFQFLINDRSFVLTANNHPYCDDLGTLPTSTVNEYVAVFPFPIENMVAFYADLQVRDISTADGTNTIYTRPSAFAAGFTTEEERYILVRNIVDSINTNPNSKISVYWESYRGVYYKDSFIFVAKTGVNRSVGTDRIEIQTTAATNQANFVTSAYTTINSITLANTIGETTTTRVNNRLTEDEELYDHLQNIYYTTKPVEPLSTQSEDFLHVYYNKSFIITKLVIDYIRKPRIISLSLNQSCELPEVSHPLVVDYATELMKLDIQDPTYKENIGDNELRNQK